MVPKMGLEPTHPKAYAPQTYVSTIPPPGQANAVCEIHRQKTDTQWFFDNVFEVKTFPMCLYDCLCLFRFAELVHPVGFEPTTNGFEDRYSSNWAMGAYSYLYSGASDADYSKRIPKCKLFYEILISSLFFLCSTGCTLHISEYSYCTITLLLSSWGTKDLLLFLSKQIPSIVGMTSKKRNNNTRKILDSLFLRMTKTYPSVRITEKDPYRGSFSLELFFLLCGFPLSRSY